MYCSLLDQFFPNNTYNQRGDKYSIHINPANVPYIPHDCEFATKTVPELQRGGDLSHAPPARATSPSRVPLPHRHAAMGALLPRPPPSCLTGSSSPGSPQKALDMLWKPFAQLLIRTALVCKLEHRTPSSSCSFLMYLKGPGNLWQDNAEHSTYL